MNRRHALQALGGLMLQATGAHAGYGAALASLRAGGVLLLRHAQTEPGIGDPPGFRIDDCGTQRNLSAAGRAQARAAGDALRAHGVRIDAVYSSAWCRCIDTAAQMFPDLRVDLLPALNSFFDGQGDRERQTAALRDWIAKLDEGRRVAMKCSGGTEGRCRSSLARQGADRKPPGFRFQCDSVISLPQA